MLCFSWGACQNSADAPSLEKYLTSAFSPGISPQAGRRKWLLVISIYFWGVCTNGMFCTCLSGEALKRPVISEFTSFADVNVFSLTAVKQLSSSLRLCLWTRTAIMSLTGGMAEISQLSSVLCQQLAYPKDASSVPLVLWPSRGWNKERFMFLASVISRWTP